MATPTWTFTYLGYWLFLSVAFFSEARFPPPSGTAPDSGSGQGGHIGFSQGVVHPLFGIPSFGNHGQMPSFGIPSSSNGVGTQLGTGPLVCTPMNCPNPGGLCGEIYINLEPQHNTHDHAAGHHQKMAMTPSY